MKRFLLLAAPPIAWAGTIVFLSSRSGGPDLSLPPGSDKVIHAIIYAVLGALTARALRGYGVPAIKSARFALILCAVFGITDELHQSTVAGRHAELADWGADLIGGALGAWGYVIFEQRRSRRAQ